MIPPLPPKPRLLELDALRGIAAVAVVLFHHTVVFPRLFPAQSGLPFAFASGHYAVLLFFAISGFVISFSLRTTTRARDFLLRRCARLFPAYWAAMALTTAAVHLAGVRELQVPPGAIAANVFMLQGFLYLPAVDGIYWTLTIELAFYLCMLLLWRLGALARIERVLAVWLALKVAAFFLPGFSSRLTILLVLDFIPYFGIGMLAFRLWSGERTLRQQAPFAALILIALLLVDPLPYVVAALLLFALFLALLAGHLRFLRWQPLLSLGTISYALYLVHHNIGFVLLIQAARLGLSPVPAFLATAGIALLMAWAIWRFVEQPAERRLTRGLRRRRAAALEARHRLDRARFP